MKTYGGRATPRLAYSQRHAKGPNTNFDISDEENEQAVNQTIAYDIKINNRNHIAMNGSGSDSEISIMQENQSENAKENINEDSIKKKRAEGNNETEDIDDGFGFLNDMKRLTKRRRKNYSKRFLDTETLVQKNNNEISDLSLSSIENNSFMIESKAQSQAQTQIEKDVNDFLMSLNSKNITRTKFNDDKDNILNDMFKTNDLPKGIVDTDQLKQFNTNSSTDNDGKKLYNNFRTMLMKTDKHNDKEDDNDITADDNMEIASVDGTTLNNSDKISRSRKNENDENTEEDEEDLDSRSDTISYNFNELKYKGNTLKYEQDLEFLLYSETPLFVQLLNLNLAIIRDIKLKDFLAKNHINEIWELCFDKFDPCKRINNFEELRILKAFLLLNLGIGSSNILLFSHLINFIDELLSDTHLPNTQNLKKYNKINKIAQLNFMDFLSDNGLTKFNGFHYAIKLWELFNERIKMDKSSIKIFHKLIEISSENPLFIEETYLLMSKIILCHHEMLDLDGGNTTRLLINKFSQYQHRMSKFREFSQAFILLTNEKERLGMLSQREINFIIECSLSGVIDKLLALKNNVKTIIDDDDNDTNLTAIICQCALFLNVFDSCDENVVLTNWDAAIDILPQISEIVQDKFLIGIYSLAIALFGLKADNNHFDFNKQITRKITGELNLLYEIARDNKSICDKISLALEHLHK